MPVIGCLCTCIYTICTDIDVCIYVHTIYRFYILTLNPTSTKIIEVLFLLSGCLYCLYITTTQLLSDIL